MEAKIGVKRANDSLPNRPYAISGLFELIVDSKQPCGATIRMGAWASASPLNWVPTKPDGLGTRLGLAMVYGFAKQSGGHIRIDSILGRGAAVKLCLPRSQVEETVRAVEEVVKIERGEGETILVVEDEAAVRSSVAALLGALATVCSVPPTARRR
jgi:hypothetical protein